MKLIRTFSLLTILSFVLLLGFSGCAKKQLKGDEPFGRTGVEGAKGHSDSNLKPVYFEYDQFTIKEGQKDTLKASAAYLKEKQGIKIQVEGHCDERGSNEYNLGLGDRRANAVKKYLVDLGISQARISTVSFGEERPAVTGSDENSWKMNRRAEFVVVSK